MYPDFSTDNCIFGGSADWVFVDTVLCVGVFCVCGGDDFDFGVFTVFVFDGVCGGERTWALSDAGAQRSFRNDDGTKGEVDSTNHGATFGAWNNVGGSDDAVDIIWYVDEDIWLDGRNSVCADLSYDYDMFYLYLCYDLSLFILSLDVEKLDFSFKKKSLTKEIGMKRKTEVNSDFSFWLW